MSSHTKLFVVTVALALALCQASHIDTKKDAAHSSSVVVTTVAPTTNHNTILESTRKPAAAAAGVHVASTLHPSVTVESIKGTNGDHNVSFSSTASGETPAVGHTKDTGEHQLHKLCDYLKPICNSTDKIVPKQLTKIQSHFKRIVEVSAGKLGFCFLDHFGFDPNLDSISKANLLTVCNSKDLPANLKESFKSFETCASRSWDSAVDMELDKILAARANCTKNHNHAKNETVIPELVHEDDEEDESSLISAIVNKVFEDNKGQFANSSDVKFIDVSTALSTSNSSLSSSSSSSSSSKDHVEKGSSSHASVGNKTANELARDAIMNDPNTVMVLLDDSNSTTRTTTSAPSTVTNKTATSSHPHQVDHNAMNKTVTFNTTMRPASGGDSLLHNSNKSSDSVVIKHLVDKTTRAPIPTDATRLVTTTPLKGITAEPTPANKFAEPVGNKTLAAKPSAARPLPTTQKPKPVFQTLEEVLKRQEKEKQIFESRLREERESIIRELQKRQDEIDAKNAIRSLQYQREATTSHNSDARLHQLEHDRQMMIDPIGHTIKHQQYEFNKQQRLMNGRK